ncbi:ubiquinone biosynthesis O-methyltransferase [Peptococcaceae bacterium CEB3]|nr:ubiquinone biosynthesis O-methyltransferase [Peptococcaceae bacterium CEB3]
MANSQLTVDEVMERIKKAMEARRSVAAMQTTGGNASGGTVPGEGELSRLEAELRQSNLTWNVNAEYPITSHRKTIGRFIVFGKKVVRKFLRWYVNPPVDQQREFNGSVTRSLNLLAEIVRTQSEALRSATDKIEELEDLLSDNGNRLRETGNADGSLEISTDGTRDEADGNDAELLKEYLAGKVRVEELEEVRGLLAGKADESKLEAIRDMLADKAERRELDDIRETISAWREQTLAQAEEQAKRRLESELTLVADRLRRLERRINKGLHLEPGVRTIERLVREDREENPDIDYFLFEQRFRGSREDIKERQRVYLDYFKGKNKVLDIGCGRGEFVELLQENGVGVQGIDINEDMVGYCQDRGLPVIQADLFAHLESLEDNSLDGIFAAQVIEHLKPADIIRLVDLCRQKLTSSGLLILESINPENVTAVCNWFFLDPSHVRPVHPIFLKFVAEANGFREQHVLGRNPMPEFISKFDQVKGLEHWLEKANTFLFGPQDYAFVARK